MEEAFLALSRPQFKLGRLFFILLFCRKAYLKSQSANTLNKEIIMKRLFLASAILMASMASYAGCVGTGSYQTCTDDSGNNYNVSRIGNSTYVDGYNSNTGSSWNQTSTKIGNSTYHEGRAANGNTWNSTSTKIGNSTYNSGTDSDGNSFNVICNQYGCN